MYMTAEPLIKQATQLLNSRTNITLRKDHFRPYGFNKMYVQKCLIEIYRYIPYQIIDQFSGRNYSCKVSFNISKQNRPI